MKNNGNNFLEKIPIRNEKIDYNKNEKGNITLIIGRDKWIEKLIRKFYKIPEQFTVDLDGYGSQVWKLIDDHKNIYKIGQGLKEIYGDEIEPLYPRLITFIRTLMNNKFIRLQ